MERSVFDELVRQETERTSDKCVDIYVATIPNPHGDRILFLSGEDGKKVRPSEVFTEEELAQIYCLCASGFKWYKGDGGMRGFAKVLGVPVRACHDDSDGDMCVFVPHGEIVHPPVDEGEK